MLRLTYQKMILKCPLCECRYAGTCFDFKDNKALQDISKDIYEAGGVVSSVCHGAIGLLNIKLSDGSLLIKDKKVTALAKRKRTVTVHCAMQAAASPCAPDRP
jgi:putative intracellular protease/amidase